MGPSVGPCESAMLVADGRVEEEEFTDGLAGVGDLGVIGAEDRRQWYFGKARDASASVSTLRRVS